MPRGRAAILFVSVRDMLPLGCWPYRVDSVECGAWRGTPSLRPSRG